MTSEEARKVLEEQRNHIKRLYYPHTSFGLDPNSSNGKKADALSLALKSLDRPSVKEIAHYLYENQPDCFCAITKERRAEASFDIATAIY